MALKASMRILVVDHVPNIRQATRKMLQEVGFKNVTEAGDGELAWKVIQEGIESNERIEFVISEWNLPKMSGLDLLQALRGNGMMKEVPFLMVTGDAEQSTILAAVRAGANNFVVKPFSSAILQEKIGAIFQKATQRPKKKAA